MELFINVRNLLEKSNGNSISQADTTLSEQDFGLNENNSDEIINQNLHTLTKLPHHEATNSKDQASTRSSNSKNTDVLGNAGDTGRDAGVTHFDSVRRNLQHSEANTDNSKSSESSENTDISMINEDDAKNTEVTHFDAKRHTLTQSDSLINTSKLSKSHQNADVSSFNNNVDKETGVTHFDSVRRSLLHSGIKEN